MVVVKYGQDKVLNRDNGNFVKTNAWKPGNGNTPLKFDVGRYLIPANNVLSAIRKIIMSYDKNWLLSTRQIGFEIKYKRLILK